MFVTLKRTWELRDGAIKNSNDRSVLVEPGRYEIEKIENPLGYDAPWLVLKGTLIGQAEGAWKQWEGKEWEEWEIIIEE